MKLARNAFKSWSFWISVVSAMLIAAQQHLPALKGVVAPDHYATLAIALPTAIALVRVVKQRAVSGDDDV